MFTQCEAAHCWSVIPMQDTPSIKFTYDMEVVTPREVRPFVSGEFVNEDFDDGVLKSRFSMKIPVPGYLIAIVCGDLEREWIKETRVYVITEP